MTKDARMDIRLPKELKARLEEEAKRLDRSKAWVISLALSEYLRRTKE